MLDIKDVKVGDKVYYKPEHYTDGQEENGIIKEIPDNQDMFARVVFRCAGNWDRYQDYTGQQTNLLDLNAGWMNCDHDYEWIDDSFDHEFGTEVCGFWECLGCGHVDENRPYPEYEPFVDDVI